MKYLCDPQVIPTVVPNSQTDIELRVEQFRGIATWLHIDITDGQFTTDQNWPMQLAALPAGLHYEAHLMVQDPKDVGTVLARAGAERILAHREVFADESEIRETFAAWKQAGAKEVGLSLLIDTSLNSIDEIVSECDMVLLMSIGKLGHQGEPFDDRALTRVEEMHAMHPDLMVGVDGGITEATVEALVRAGANRLSVGAAISKSADPAATYARIHERAMEGCKPLTMELM
jgi:ribulose-phosphate 3-epimerase